MSAIDLCLGIFFLVGFAGCLVSIPFIHRACDGHIRALELSDKLEADRMRLILANGIVTFNAKGLVTAGSNITVDNKGRITRSDHRHGQ